MDTISDCVASNVIEISDKDELEVYGSDIRTSTQLTSYVFEVSYKNSLIRVERDRVNSVKETYGRDEE